MHIAKNRAETQKSSAGAFLRKAGERSELGRREPTLPKTDYSGCFGIKAFPLLSLNGCGCLLICPRYWGRSNPANDAMSCSAGSDFVNWLIKFAVEDPFPSEPPLSHTV